MASARAPSLTIELATWLVGDDGRAAIARATDLLDGDADELSLIEALRADGLDVGQSGAALDAAHARRRARGQWPRADELVLTRDGLEQASSPAVAAHRAARMAAAADAAVDLCAGLGADALALAAAGAAVVAVDLDPARLALLAHNAEVLGHGLETRTGEALEVDLPVGAAVHADPGRRRDGRRLRALADLEPSGAALLARMTDRPAGLTCSPAIALDDPDLPAEAELEFVADADGLREATVWVGDARRPGVVASATLLPDGQRLERSGPAEALPVGPPGEWLIEAHPAAVRARLHDELGRAIGARRLAHRRALLTSNAPPPASPWYRARPVLARLPLRPRAIRAWLREHDAPIEIATHGVDRDPEALWRELGRPPRGPQGVRLELVRTDDGAHVLVTDAGAGGTQSLR